MAKIYFSKFKKDLKITEMKNGNLFIKGGENYRGTSKFSQSTAHKVCPCCGTQNEVVIWSFSGSGKRCLNCRVLLTWLGGHIDPSKLSNKNYKEFKALNLEIKKH